MGKKEGRGPASKRQDERSGEQPKRERPTEEEDAQSQKPEDLRRGGIR